MSINVPQFSGATVKRITLEPNGLTLWVRTATGPERGYSVDDAVTLHSSLGDGLARNELADALALCGVTGSLQDRRR